MRDLSVEQLDILNQQITKPLYLIELGLGDTRYYSTGQTITLDGITYTGGVVGIVSATNWQEVSLQLINSDYALTSLILSGIWRGGVCKITWLPVAQQLYFDPGYVDEGYYDTSFYGDPVVVIDGELVSSSVNTRVNLLGRAKGMSNSWTTRQRVAAPVFNHLPAPGITVVVNGETYTIEAAS